jgi:hypothetical protein
LPVVVPLTEFLALQLTTIRAKKIKITAIALLTFLSFSFTYNWLAVQAYRPVEYYKQVVKLAESSWQPSNSILIYPGYVSNTVKHYFQKIPTEAAIIVPMTGNLEQLKQELQNHLNNSNFNACSYRKRVCSSKSLAKTNNSSKIFSSGSLFILIPSQYRGFFCLLFLKLFLNLLNER